MSGASTFAPRLLAWFDQHGRHDLPWQHPREPYRVLVSEIMLQQTQVRTVIGYFERFMARFPTLQGLSDATLDDVFAAWSGLGYYARARNLHRTAQRCVAQHQALLPDNFDALVQLPGIGRSTAGAILAQAHGQRHAILDGNVRRVLSRHRRIAGDPALPAVQKRLWSAAENVLPDTRLADYTQALMDLGAGVCTRSRPACQICPMADDCEARIHGEQGLLPTRRTPRDRPLRTCVQLLLTQDGRLLLQRRVPVGIWAGLWSFIEADDDQAARAALRGLGYIVLDFEAHAQIRHEFTHYSLDIDVRRALVHQGTSVTDADLRWFTPAEALALGLPQPVRRLIENLVISPQSPRRSRLSKTVHCVRYGPDQPGLDRQPYPGELGERLLAHVSKQAWSEWLAHQTLLINENRLSPVDPKSRQFLKNELEKYFFGEGSGAPAGYVVPD